MNQQETLAFIPDNKTVELTEANKISFHTFQIFNSLIQEKKHRLPKAVLMWIGVYLDDSRLEQWNRFEHIHHAIKIVNGLTDPDYLSQTQKQEIKLTLEENLKAKQFDAAYKDALRMGELLLIKAAEFGDVTIAEKIFKLMPNVDVNAEQNWKTPLIAAISNYQLAVVELLLKQPNIQINKKPKNGHLSLYHAVAITKGWYDINIINALLSANAVDVKLLHDTDYAQIYVQASDQRVKDALEKAADRVREVFIEDSTEYIRSFIRKRNLDSLPQLNELISLNKEQPINQRLKNVVNFAVVTTQKDLFRIESIKTLLKKALKIGTNKAAVSFAIEYGCVELIKHLMRQIVVPENSMYYRTQPEVNIYSFVNQRIGIRRDDCFPEYPLELLTYYGHTDCVELLLKQKNEDYQHGVQFSQTPWLQDSLKTTLKWSILKGHTEIYKLFLEDKDMQTLKLNFGNIGRFPEAGPSQPSHTTHPMLLTDDGEASDWAVVHHKKNKKKDKV